MIPQLYDLTGAMLGLLVMAGKIIASHMSDLCPGVDLKEPLVGVSHEAADLVEKFLSMLQGFNKVNPVPRRIIGQNEELDKIVIAKDGG